MPTYLKLLIGLIIIAIGLAYWHVRSNISPIYFTPDDTVQIEKTP